MGLGMELSGRRKDGSLFPVEVGLSTLTTRTGPLAVSFITDITQRKLAEHERERNLRRFTEVAPVAIAMFDREMRYLAVSQRFRDDFHLGDQELLGRSHYQIFPEISESWRAIHRRCLAGAVEKHPGEGFTRADGTEQWLRWEIQPWRQSDGEIGGIVLYSEDITQQIQSAKELREQEAEFRTLADAIPQLCWMANADGGIFWYNQRWCDYTGTTQDQMVGWDWQAAHDPAALPEVLRRWNESIATGQPLDMVFPLRGADGVFRPFLTRVMPVRDAAGRVVRWFGTNTDISEQRRIEEALRAGEEELQRLNAELEQRVLDRTAQWKAANAELEAFCYSVSHDLRAPLRGIDGWSLALQEDYGPELNQEASQYLKRIRSETQRMGLLIHDLLELSRVTRIEMQHAPVDLTSAALTVVSRLRESLPGRQIDFIVEPGMVANGDARLLEIALTNLIGNAAKFTGTRSAAHIEIGRIEGGGEVTFFVRDDGVGFDMSHAGNLFGAFQRLHKASEFPGTGVGLAIVQRVIHRHGGRVWAESQPDRGATFYFQLAAAEELYETVAPAASVNSEPVI
jgi:PAS domain S-box-containing protein